MRYLLILLPLLLSGCGGAPFVKVGGYIHNNAHSRPPVAKFEVGYEWERASCEWVHISQPSEGSPFNRRPDYVAVDAAGCSYKFGGL
jgi:hypothetical protein